MSDSERDAWLREALRHAPDADAAPPRDLSETILAQARAEARVGGAPGRAARRRNPVLALWDWLARPPVAAGFASVMAATLVGLMWWGRPMDETLQRRPDAAAARIEPPLQAEVGTATPPQTATRQDVEDTQRSANKLASPAAKDQAPEPRLQAPPPYDATTDAKAPQRKPEAANENLLDRVPIKPSPFPRSDDERSAAKKKDADATHDKALDRATKEEPSDALAARNAHLAKSLPVPAAAPPAPAETLRSEPPAAFGQQRATEAAQTSPAMTIVESDAAKRARGAGAPAQSAPAAAAVPTIPAPPVPPSTTTMPGPAAAAPPPASRDNASNELSEKQAGAAAPSRADGARRSLGSSQREGAAATPLAPILAALASDPSRWSRSTATGTLVALEPGWPDWLAQLDATARDRWQPGGAAVERERDGATTLRLVDGGRTVAVVRLDGTMVRVDVIDRGERWQATLPPATAEQLRSAAERLGR